MNRRLSLRQLNRATLARQGLLAPLDAPTTADAVMAIGSLQAQHPEWPPVALAARTFGAGYAALPQALEDHSVVRAALMRITVHIVAAADFWPMSTLSQPLRHLQFRSLFKADPVASPLGRRLSEGHAAVRAALRERPLRIRDMVAIMRAEIPDLADDPHRRYWRHIAATIPLVHVPFDGEGYGRSRYALAEGWVEPPPADLDEQAALAHLTERYLAAFGPASVDDLMAYAGRRGSPKRWHAALAALGDRIERFVDEDGQELFDLVDAPRPAGDVVAPPRLLARWDSLLLSHASSRRQRVIADEHRSAVYTRNADVLPTFLLDGFVAGTWELERQTDAARLVLRPFAALSTPTQAALEAEAERMLTAIAPEVAQREVLTVVPERLRR
jgi:hypothetical protein